MSRHHFPSLRLCNHLLPIFVTFTRCQDPKIEPLPSTCTVDGGVFLIPLNLVLQLATGFRPHKNDRLQKIANREFSLINTFLPHSTDTTRLIFLPDCQPITAYTSSAVNFFKKSNKAFPAGEAFLIELFTLRKKQVIAGVQFQRTPKGVFINLLSTLDPPKNEPPPITSDTFRSKGLSILLLRAVQLYQCCHGHPPDLFIQCPTDNVDFYSYLTKRGFQVIVNKEKLHQLDELFHISTTPSVLWNQGDANVVMHIPHIVKSFDTAAEWKKPIYLPLPLFSEPGLLNTHTMFQFPILANGGYVDQCANGLLHLGAPFFYYMDPNALAKHNSDLTLEKNAVNFGTFSSLRSITTKQDHFKWLNQECLQFMTNWIFRDNTNPTLQQFHVVPLAVSATIRMLFEGAGEGLTRQIAKVLHNYCANNWQRLDSKMIFYIQNISGSHWILNVAVNPSSMMAHVMSYDESPLPLENVFGYLYVDPMEVNRNGTIPKPARKSRPALFDDPTANRQLVFLLNYMSRYRDIALQGQQTIGFKTLTMEDIWVLGGAGPFGAVFYSDEKPIYQNLRLQSLIHLPQMKTFQKVLPTQTDSYNCGPLVIVMVMDLVLTQWDKQWLIRDFLEP